MKISRGFVAAVTDGSFLNIYEIDTHTGHHVRCALVEDIEQASVFQSPRFPSLSMRREAPDVNWVPVEVRREVILKGFGT